MKWGRSGGPQRQHILWKNDFHLRSAASSNNTTNRSVIPTGAVAEGGIPGIKQECSDQIKDEPRIANIANPASDRVGSFVSSAQLNPGQMEEGSPGSNWSVLAGKVFLVIDECPVFLTNELNK